MIADFPGDPRLRDRWILDRRGPRNPVEPSRPYAAFVEEEAGESGELASVATVFLSNRECPWRCLMCDLWKNTLEEDTPPGAIPEQIRHAIAELPASRWIKLYNSGSFFDAKAIPPSDDEAIASLLAPFERVIVESHPALVGPRCERLQRLLPGRLEVAMGLETIHPEILPRLNKRMTLAQYRRATDFLNSRGIAHRAFLLVGLPWIESAEALDWALRSAAFAFDCGACAVSLIPTRSGNGAMEALQARGEFAPPRLSLLEAAASGSPGHAPRPRVQRPLEPRDAVHVRGLFSRAPAPALGHEPIAEGPPPRLLRDLRGRVMPRAFDAAIVGSGFAGSLTALLLRRLGRSVILVEKGSHPRFAIGESSSPLANLLLETLCERYGLPRIAPLAAWGSWRRKYPEVGCGLKRGFTFYGHRSGHPFGADPARSDQLLVAASPNDEVADTHWYRSEFDHFLLREAQAEGAEYVDRTLITGLSWQGDVASLDTMREGRRGTLRARLVIDASGPAGFLHRALRLRAEPFPDLPLTEGLYTHFSGVRRLEDMGIFPSPQAPPYPVDDAAVHHVFEGGWIWVLRFHNGVTSAGIAATPRLAKELILREGSPAWGRLLESLPTVAAQFSEAEPILPFIHQPRLPFRSAAAAGPNWVLLPSAAAFVDPLLSTGFPLTLLGIERLIGAVETDWGRASLAPRLAADGARTLAEADAAALLVSALNATFGDFPLFAALTHLYFAAASFAEASRRLSRPQLSGAFLSADHPTFGPALRECCRTAIDGPPEEREKLRERIAAAIEPLDVIGLSDASRRNWYPVDADDLRASAGKLGATRSEIEELLRRMNPAEARPIAAVST